MAFWRKKKQPDRFVPARQLFDASWYARKYGVGIDEHDAWRHYTFVGRMKGYSPNPLFDPAWYCRIYEACKPEDALLHFAMEGSAQGFRPSPLFENHWYARVNSDAVGIGINPLAHYLHFGRHEGRAPASWCHERTAGFSQDLSLALDFALDDLIGYFPGYHVASQLASEPDASIFFTPATPRWIFARLSSESMLDDPIPEAIVIGGRSEIIVNNGIYQQSSQDVSIGTFRAFAVTFTVSPIVRDAVHFLGLTPSTNISQDGMLLRKRCLPSVTLLIDAFTATAPRDVSSCRPVTSPSFVSVAHGAMLRVQRLYRAN